MALDITLPTTAYSRSTTNENGGSSDGTQSALDNEETIDFAMLYFFTDNNGEPGDYITAFKAYSNNLTGPTTSKGETKYTVKTQVIPNDLKMLAGKNLQLLVVANEDTHNFNNHSENSSYTGTFSPIQAFMTANDPDASPLGLVGEDGKKVPFANYEAYPVDFSKLEYKNDDDQFLEDIYKLLNEQNEINLSKENGDLQLERMVARIDLRPEKGANDLPYNVYQIGNVTDLYGELTEMQVFNLAKDMYIFRHTIAGNATKANFQSYNDIPSNVKIFGKENSNVNFGSSTIPEGGDASSYKWIADPDWVSKLYAIEAWGQYYRAGIYNNELTKDNNGPYHINSDKGKITTTELFGENKDSYSYTYHPWIYLPENTQPSIKAMSKGFCSGIAFRVVMCNREGTPLTEDNFTMENEAPGDEQPDATADGEETPKVGTLSRIGSTDFYNIKIGNDESYAEAIKDDEDNITGFALTYYYFIRHNVSDGHVLGQVEPMQFAVVRNNVYQISVGKLNGLPEKFIPGDPAEPQNNPAILVNLNVLSWAKHKIDMEW